MEFRDVVRRRRMVRNYDPDRPVPPEVRERILEHAIRAPSAGFSQGWAFLVLEEPADRDRFWQAATPQDRRLAAVAGQHAPGAADHRAALQQGASTSTGTPQPDKGWTDRDEARWPVPYWDIDTGFASLLMLLTAVDEGLGACFFGIPPEQIAAYRAEFGVPDGVHPDRRGQRGLPGAGSPLRLAQAGPPAGGRSGPSRAVGE